MIEDVKELRPYSKVSAFPVGNLKRLGDREVAIEELRTGELVPALLAEASGGETEVRSEQARSGRVRGLAAAGPRDARVADPFSIFSRLRHRVFAAVRRAAHQLAHRRRLQPCRHHLGTGRDVVEVATEPFFGDSLRHKVGPAQAPSLLSNGAAPVTRRIAPLALPI